MKAGQTPFRQEANPPGRLKVFQGMPDNQVDIPAFPKKRGNSRRPGLLCLQMLRRLVKAYPRKDIAMSRLLLFLAIALAVLLVIHALAAWKFRRFGAGLAAQVASGQAGAAALPRSDLPGPVAGFARRGLAGALPSGGHVRLTQAAEMEMKPGAGWQPIKAEQVIGLRQAGFVWQARQVAGPVTVVRVIDAYVAGGGLLQARLLGSIPVARAEGAEMNRGEAMRYLAELPWAPDAIAMNRDIRWRMLESGEAEARLEMVPRDAVVRFAFDAAGDIATIRAEDRPATGPDGNTVLKPWEGHFSDYREMGGRRIPARGEVGYVEPEGYRPYWRGGIVDYAVN